MPASARLGRVYDALRPSPAAAAAAEPTHYLNTAPAVTATEEVSKVLAAHDHTVHDISHGPGFANHLSHGVLAFAELGAPPLLLRGLADSIGTHSLEPAKDDTPPTPLTDRAQVLALRGERRHFSALVRFFESELASSSVQATLSTWLPPLFSAVSTALVHAFISIGLGVRSGEESVICQGLAWVIYSCAPQPELVCHFRSFFRVLLRVLLVSFSFSLVFFKQSPDFGQSDPPPPATEEAATVLGAIAAQYGTDGGDRGELMGDPKVHALVDTIALDPADPGRSVLQLAAAVCKCTRNLTCQVLVACLWHWRMDLL